MASRILDIQKRSNQYMKNFDANVIGVIERSDIKEKLLDINRDQFMKHKDADFMPLIHNSTKSQSLTKAYARKTGKSKPDFFVSGDFWDKMLLTMPSAKEYFITSKSYVSRWLSLHYGKIFGISPKGQPKAHKITDPAIIKDHRKKVFGL